MSRLSYFLRSAYLSADRERRRCPNCGGDGKTVQRKYVVTTLRRCSDCLMQYRAPTDSPVESERFYNDEYSQGVTTELPRDEQELERMKRDRFPEQDNAYPYFIEVLRSLGVRPGDRLFDFGCSWGYGSYQLVQAGYDVKAYEISRERGVFAHDKLGIDLVDDFDAFVDRNRGSFDVFFSSHVLEHVPSPTSAINAGIALLKPGGLFLSFFPNCSLAWRAADPDSWKQLWGKVHPNALDEVYLARAFAAMPHLIGSSPVKLDQGAVTALASSRPGTHLLDGLGGSYELMVASRKPHGAIDRKLADTDRLS